MLFNSCVREALLHGSECWALRKKIFQRLLRNERAMLHWMCKVKAEDDLSLHDMYSRLSHQNAQWELAELAHHWLVFSDSQTQWRPKPILFKSLSFER